MGTKPGAKSVTCRWAHCGAGDGPMQDSRGEDTYRTRRVFPQDKTRGPPDAAAAALFLGHRHLLHHVPLLNAVDDMLAFHYVAEYRMLAVQPGGGHVGDEELRAVGVGA